MKNMSYLHLRYIESFTEWLQVLNYSKSTIQRMPGHLQELFYWMQSQQIESIEQLTRPHLHTWFEHLKYERRNQRKGTFLTGQTLNDYIRAIKLFAFYLEETQQARITVDLVYEKKKETNPRTILTPQEIQTLYQATNDDYNGIRERIILHLYYGCGLRSKEGLALDLDDVMLDKRMIYVRKGKGYKERYVPFVNRQHEDFEQYLNYARPKLTDDPSETAFLIGHKGRRLRYGMAVNMLKRIQQRTGDEVLQQKVIGLHSLRHSIATHLMQRGMKFDYIGHFLGHSNLNSTQIYTHLAHEHST